MDRVRDSAPWVCRKRSCMSCVERQDSAVFGECHWKTRSTPFTRFSRSSIRCYEVANKETFLASGKWIARTEQYEEEHDGRVWTRCWREKTTDWVPTRSRLKNSSLARGIQMKP